MRTTTMIVAAMLLVVPAAAASAAVTVSGRVYLDANGNGAYDAGETPIPGVRVTDSVAFVTTAADGTYALQVAADPMIPYQPAQTVSMSWPGGQWPTSQWWVRMSDVADPGNVNFGLRDQAQTRPFTFAQISDDHGALAGSPAGYVNFINGMGGNLRMVFNTGDTSRQTDAFGNSSFAGMAGVEAQFHVPTFNTPGNHDMPSQPAGPTGTPDDTCGWGPWTKDLGPVRWSFNYGGVHFAGIDYGDGAVSGVQQVAVNWLNADLAAVPAGMKKVVLVHYPQGPAEDSLYNVLALRKVDLVLGGHTHGGEYAKFGGVLGMTNYAAGLVSVTDDSLAVGERLSYGGGKYQYFYSALRYFDDCVAPAMVLRRGASHGVTGQTLTDTTVAVTGGPATSAEIVVEINPGSSHRVGLRIGQTESVEIAWADGQLQVGEAFFPIQLAAEDTTLKWHILVDQDRLTVTEQEYFPALGRTVSRFRLPIDVEIDAPTSVTAFAEGGSATFVSLNVWDLADLANPIARTLCHYAPEGWYWGRGYFPSALSDPGANEAFLAQYGPDGFIHYGIPEPATLSLLAVSGILLLKRRRKPTA